MPTLAASSAKSEASHSASTECPITFTSWFECPQRMPCGRRAPDQNQLVAMGSRALASIKNFAWQAGYGAFSVSESGVDAVRSYIVYQEQHHTKRSFKDEFVVFLEKPHRRRREISLDLTLLTPLRGFVTAKIRPRACALGFILAPLRGFSVVPSESLGLQHRLQILRMNRTRHRLFAAELLLKHQLRQRFF